MSARTEQRKLAAIMFTDMVGCSSLAQRNEALTLESVPRDDRQKPSDSSLGCTGANAKSPAGATEPPSTCGDVQFSRPSGALARARFSPAVNRWAIVSRPPD